MSSGPAFRPSRLTRMSSSPLLDQAEGNLVDAVLLVPLLDDGLAVDVAEQGDLVLVVRRRSGTSVRQIRMSGWMPICRSAPTECWVGLVLSSAAALR